jgi:hypothetical protein
MKFRLSQRGDPNAKTATAMYSYQQITEHCENQIAYSLKDAARHGGQEAQDRLERAYGVYMGWRTLALSQCAPCELTKDALRFEDMINEARTRALAKQTNSPR